MKKDTSKLSAQKKVLFIPIVNLYVTYTGMERNLITLKQTDKDFKLLDKKFLLMVISYLIVNLMMTFYFIILHDLNIFMADLNNLQTLDAVLMFLAIYLYTISSSWIFITYQKKIGVN